MKYKKIKYEQEYDNTRNFNSTSYTYIFFCLFMPLILLVFIIITALIMKYVNTKLGVPLLILINCSIFGIPVFLHIRHKKIDNQENVFKKMRRRFINNGKLFYGVITDIKQIQSTETVFIGRIARTINVVRYIYVAHYTNDDNEEREIESYIVLNADRNCIGRKCTIYECEGKALLNAIEQRC